MSSFVSAIAQKKLAIEGFQKQINSFQSDYNSYTSDLNKKRDAIDAATKKLASLQSESAKRKADYDACQWRGSWKGWEGPTCSAKKKGSRKSQQASLKTNYQASIKKVEAQQALLINLNNQYNALESKSNGAFSKLEFYNGEKKTAQEELKNLEQQKLIADEQLAKEKFQRDQTSKVTDASIAVHSEGAKNAMPASIKIGLGLAALVAVAVVVKIVKK